MLHLENPFGAALLYDGSESLNLPCLCLQSVSIIYFECESKEIGI